MDLEEAKKIIVKELCDTEDMIAKHEREILGMNLRITPGSIRDDLLYEKGKAKGLRLAQNIYALARESEDTQK